MANPPRSIAVNPLSAPDNFPMGVRAPPTITEPGMNGLPRLLSSLAYRSVVECGLVDVVLVGFDGIQLWHRAVSGCRHRLRPRARPVRLRAERPGCGTASRRRSPDRPD